MLSSVKANNTINQYYILEETMGSSTGKSVMKRKKICAKIMGLEWNILDMTKMFVTD